MLVNGYGDMFYAIESATNNTYKICKVFYNQDKCKKYIKEVNHEREHQIAEEQYTH